MTTARSAVDAVMSAVPVSVSSRPITLQPSSPAAPPGCVASRRQMLRPRAFLRVEEKNAVYKIKCQTARRLLAFCLPRDATTTIATTTTNNNNNTTSTTTCHHHNNNNSNNDECITNMTDYVSLFSDDDSALLEDFSGFSEASGDDKSFYIFYDNDTSSDVALQSEAAQLHTRLVPAVLLFICALGLVGNGLVIFVIAHYLTVRKVTYLYLMNLAIVNILYLLASAPITATNYALTNWPFGAFVCKLNGYVSSVCLTVSVLTLAATGFDRYLAVLHPVRSRGFRTEKTAVIVVVIIWATSLALAAPRVLLYDLHDMWHISDLRTFCTRSEASVLARRIDSGLTFLGTYLLPQLALAFCHLKIGLRLWFSRRPGVASQDVSVLGLRERRKVAKIVFAITLAFGIGWLPMHVVTLYEDFSGQGDRIAFANRAALVFGFSFGANAVNPVLYCLLSKHFRTYFKCAVTCKSPAGDLVVNAPRQTARRPTAVYGRNPQQATALDLQECPDGEQPANDNREPSASSEDRNPSFRATSDGREQSSSRAYGFRTPERQRTVLQVAPLPATTSSNASLECDDPRSGSKSDLLKVPSGRGEHHGKVLAQDTDKTRSSLPQIV